MTSGWPANRCATISQVLVNVEPGQLSLYHRPLQSASEQHHPGYSRWQFGMTASPAAVSDSVTAW